MVWSWGVRIRGALVNGLLILTIFQDILKCCIVDGFQSNRFCTRPVNPVATVGSAKVNDCHTGLIGLFFEISRIEKLVNKLVGIVAYSGRFLAVIGSVEVIEFHTNKPAGIIVPTKPPIFDTLPTHDIPFKDMKVANQ